MAICKLVPAKSREPVGQRQPPQAVEGDGVMGEAMNATVRITGGHLDLSDVSDKTILFVAVGTGGKSCN